MRILTSEEARIITEEVLGLDCCRGIGDNNPILAYKIGQVQRATAEAQAKLTREETLKEVGEWLQLCDCTTTPHSKRISVDFDDVMKITNGEMPE